MSPHAHTNRNLKPSQWPHDGEPSVFTCPDCQGTLFLIGDDGISRFRCRTGHTYSPESMFEAQAENIERIMWSAVRALSEQAEYADELARLMRQSKDKRSQKYEAINRAAKHSAEIIRKLITRGTENRKSTMKL